MPSKIEWLRDPISGKLGYSMNPIKGLCPMACSYCYARRMYKRFKWNPEIRFDREVPIYGFPIGSKVFIGSTMELFGDWVKEDWLKTIFANVRESPDVTFIFLTKCPNRLAPWSPFPSNCWVGASAWDLNSFFHARNNIRHIKAGVRFISLEPLLDWAPALYRKPAIKECMRSLSWLILGAQTPYSPKTAPKIEWVKEIVDAADQAGIPVFLKENLYSLWYNKTNDGSNQIPQWALKKGGYGLRQEFPK